MSDEKTIKFEMPSQALLSPENALLFLSSRLEVLSLEIQTLRRIVDYAQALNNSRNLERSAQEKQ